MKPEFTDFTKIENLPTGDHREFVLEGQKLTWTIPEHFRPTGIVEIGMTDSGVIGGSEFKKKLWISVDVDVVL